MDEVRYMRRCLELARMGEGKTAPNPMVGSVIVYQGRIIGEGYHHHYGEAHAEVNAIEAVKDKRQLQESTLYVNLEPCSHYGKTPPCSDRIIQEGIPRVVIGTTDSNSLVGGKGIEKMQKAGLDVHVGVLEEECHYLNRSFFTYHQHQRPYVILKWAQTIDGFMDKKRSLSESPHVNWITGERLKVLVHRWRAVHPAILVGSVTALNDNPALTVREWVGENPLRLVVDEENTLPSHLQLFDQQVPTIVFSQKAKADKKNLRHIQLDFAAPIASQVLQYLYQQQIQSLIVEGGRKMLETFIREGLWDEIRVLSGDKFFYSGLKAPAVPKQAQTIDHVGNDRLIHVVNPANPFLALKAKSNNGEKR
ncbi:MAG: bifunctional diaminohydroxyphosphoribosylaminopyrimidine deaminase/5-amino-6-(5-phosphoribosylamino)uracil reductase RibD [Bacteroidota bacterium]